MERVKDKYPSLISAGLSLIPTPILKRLGYLDFFTGSDPIYAGLFNYEESDDGRSYRQEWCVAYPHHLTMQPKNKRKTTIVLADLLPEHPKKLHPFLIVHEVGHVLDYLLDFRFDFEAVTKYAQTNRMEAFADAFTLWVSPQYEEFYRVKRPVDDYMKYVFEGLLNG